MPGAATSTGIYVIPCLGVACSPLTCRDSFECPVQTSSGLLYPLGKGLLHEVLNDKGQDDDAHLRGHVLSSAPHPPGRPRGAHCNGASMHWRFSKIKSPSALLGAGYDGPPFLHVNQAFFCSSSLWYVRGAIAPTTAQSTSSQAQKGLWQEKGVGVPTSCPSSSYLGASYLLLSGNERTKRWELQNINRTLQALLSETWLHKTLKPGVTWLHHDYQEASRR